MLEKCFRAGLKGLALRWLMPWVSRAKEWATGKEKNRLALALKGAA
jgi:hypothetical protein